MEKLRIAGTVNESIVDGPGIRYVIFVQGCPHRCKGCHNPSTHDFDKGIEADIDKILSEIDSDPLLTGVTISGGEPFSQAEQLIELVDQIKLRNKHLLFYTGYTLDQLINKAVEDKSIEYLLSKIDVLIDGPFILEERDLELSFRGSRNQRIIKLK